MLNLIRHVEERENGQHPLERTLSTTTDKDQTLVTTTGVHLARRIGEALSRAYQGDLSFQYLEGEDTIRVSWQR